MVNAYAARAAKGRLEPFEYEPGPLAPHEVEVKPTHCGICHSDIAMIDNEWGFSTYPVVPGHEVIGHITAVGSGVDTVQVGQRVGVGWQCGSCGRCEWCGKGLESLCAQNQPTIVHHHGGWADSVRTQAKFAIPIPEGLDSADAAPLMCAGTTVFTPMMRFGVTPWMKAAVVGVGGLGHLAVQYLAAFGCEVTAISSSHDKDEATRKLGATDFLATRGTDELTRAAGRFDFILSTVSADMPWAQYVEALRPQGRLVLVGIPEKDLAIPAMPLLLERSVSGGCSGSPTDTAAMLAFTARHAIKPILERYPLGRINEAVDRVREGKARFRAVLEYA